MPTGLPAEAEPRPALGQGWTAVPGPEGRGGARVLRDESGTKRTAVGQLAVRDGGGEGKVRGNGWLFLPRIKAPFS